MFHRSLQVGMSLANTLVASSVMVTLAFATASLAVSQLTLNSRLANRQMAKDLAESVASDCLATLMQDSRWQGDRELFLSHAPGGWGRASFSATVSRTWGISPSTNNLHSKLPGISQADGSSLPAAALELISVGHYRGQSLKVVQMVVIPPFKYALASSGEIVSNGGLTVASIEDPALLANGFDSLLEEHLKAGNLAGNQASPRSVILNATPTRPVYIKGQVDSAGEVKKTRFAKVAGGVSEKREPAVLPDILIADYDPRERSDVVHLKEATSSRLLVEQPLRRQGDLKVSSGLEISRGYLYVDGDLDIYGGIRGKGAIFATGSIKIHGVSTFGANHQQAIVAGGDVAIEGLNRNQSTFQGVIYTQGDFRGKDVTLVGSLVANKPKSQDPEGSRLTLDACNVLHNRQIVDNIWSSGFEPGMQPSTLGLGADPSFSSSGDLFSSEGKPLNFVLDPEASDFYDPQVDQYRVAAADNSAFQMSVLVPRWDGGREKFASMAEALRILGNPNHGLQITVAPSQAEIEEVRAANLRIIQQNLGRAIRRLPPLPLQPLPSATPTWTPEVMTKLRLIAGKLTRSTPLSLAERSILEDKVRDFNDYYLRTRARWMHQGHFGFSFNPNQFISMSDKARRMTWSDDEAR